MFVCHPVGLGRPVVMMMVVEGSVKLELVIQGSFVILPQPSVASHLVGQKIVVQMVAMAVVGLAMQEKCARNLQGNVFVSLCPLGKLAVEETVEMFRMVAVEQSVVVAVD